MHFKSFRKRFRETAHIIPPVLHCSSFDNKFADERTTRQRLVVQAHETIVPDTVCRDGFAVKEPVHVVRGHSCPRCVTHQPDVLVKADILASRYVQLRLMLNWIW